MVTWGAYAPRRMGRVLVVEDEAIVRSEIQRLLVRAGHDVAEAASVDEALEHGLDNFDLVISDIRLPGDSGLTLLEKRDSRVPVLIMTSFASVKSAVEAMKLGANDYVSKPFDPDELLLVVDRLLHQDRLQRQNLALKKDVEEEWGVEGMIAEGPAMAAVLDRIKRVAPTGSTVLILGESGTGKELAARAIHRHSSRADAPFVAVNCAAIPETLIESELFGHEKGAFTGAVTRRTGLVESAHAGTLFLDEVGELPASAQARLLRVLQESEVRHVGSSRSRKVDVRIIAATHRDLPKMVKEGTFREDLFFRLRVLDIRIPPLRERREDLEPLMQFLLQKASRKVGCGPLRVTDDAKSRVLSHDWPGNVRELENALERAAILCDDSEITGDLLGIETDEGDAAVFEGTAAEAPPSEDNADSLVEYFKRFVVAHQGELGETELAKRLGISRKALWERRRKLGIPRPKN